MSKIEYKYDEMNDWLFEIENYGTRLERFYEEVDHLTDNSLRNYAILLKWLNAAFEMGRLEKDEGTDIHDV